MTPNVAGSVLIEKQCCQLAARARGDPSYCLPCVLAEPTCRRSCASMVGAVQQLVHARQGLPTSWKQAPNDETSCCARPKTSDTPAPTQQLPAAAASRPTQTLSRSLLLLLLLPGPRCRRRVALRQDLLGAAGDLGWRQPHLVRGLRHAVGHGRNLCRRARVGRRANKRWTTRQARRGGGRHAGDQAHAAQNSLMSIHHHRNHPAHTPGP